MITHDDQATQLRRLVRRQQDRAMVLAVVSGKGGVGKTNLAVNLSIGLAAHGRRVVLIDADLGLANADVLLNVSPHRTLSHVLAGRCGLDDVIIDAPGGISFVPGASGVARLANVSEFERRAILDILGSLEQKGDILVLDCGAGISRNVTAFAMAADQVLVVTTPEPTALTDAYAVAKVLHKDSFAGSISTVVNLATNRFDANATHERLAGVAQRFLGLRLGRSGYILHDEHVARAVRERCPVLLRYPRCPASVCFAALAGELAGSVGAVARNESFFSRVVNLFF